MNARDNSVKALSIAASAFALFIVSTGTAHAACADLASLSSLVSRAQAAMNSAVTADDRTTQTQNYNVAVAGYNACMRENSGAGVTNYHSNPQAAARANLANTLNGAIQMLAQHEQEEAAEQAQAEAQRQQREADEQAQAAVQKAMADARDAAQRGAMSNPFGGQSNAGSGDDNPFRSSSGSNVTASNDDNPFRAQQPSAGMSATDPCLNTADPGLCAMNRTAAQNAAEAQREQQIRSANNASIQQNIDNLNAMGRGSGAAVGGGYPYATGGVANNADRGASGSADSGNPFAASAGTANQANAAPQANAGFSADNAAPTARQPLGDPKEADDRPFMTNNQCQGQHGEIINLPGAPYCVVGSTWSHLDKPY